MTCLEYVYNGSLFAGADMAALERYQSRFCGSESLDGRKALDACRIRDSSAVAEARFAVRNRETLPEV